MARSMPSTFAGASSVCRIVWARSRRSSSSSSWTRMANSSPPIRARVMSGGSESRMRRATSSRRVSPALWPRVSLTSLKPSRSSSMRPRGSCAVMPSSSAFRTARRFGQAGEVVGLGELERDARFAGLPQGHGEPGTGGHEGDGGRHGDRPAQEALRADQQHEDGHEEGADEEAGRQATGHAHLRRPRGAGASDDEHEGRAPHHREDVREAVGSRAEVEDEAGVRDGEQDEAGDQRDRAPVPLPGVQRPLADDDEGQGQVQHRVEDGHEEGQAALGEVLGERAQQDGAGHGADAADHDHGVQPGRLRSPAARGGVHDDECGEADVGREEEALARRREGGLGRGGRRVEDGRADVPEDDPDGEGGQGQAATGPDDGRDEPTRVIQMTTSRMMPTSMTVSSRSASVFCTESVAMMPAPARTTQPRTPSSRTTFTPSRNEPRRAASIRGPPRSFVPAFLQGYKRVSGSPVRRPRCGEGCFSSPGSVSARLPRPGPSRVPSPGSRPARRRARGRRSARGPCGGTAPRWSRRCRSWTR